MFKNPRTGVFHMSIGSEQDLLGLLRIGRIVGLTLQEMQNRVRPGMTTVELDGIGAEVMQKHGARSAPQFVYGFPGATCISLNDEAAHGIPGERMIHAGDLVKIDVTAELDGYVADAAYTVAVPPVSPARRRLCDCAKAALKKSLAAARAGQPINAIGRAAEKAITSHGFAVLKELCGHGVGRTIHEEPRVVPHYYVPQFTQRLTEGLVLAIEPHVSAKATRIVDSQDGWTLKTANHTLVANYEHTIVVTQGQPIVVTAI
jgi:methionyl aminopeptidase